MRRETKCSPQSVNDCRAKFDSVTPLRALAATNSQSSLTSEWQLSPRTRLHFGYSEPSAMGCGLATKAVSVQLSIGIALNGPLAESPEVLVRNADLAMYTAKRNGKDRFETFEQAMYSRRCPSLRSRHRLATGARK